MATLLSTKDSRRSALRNAATAGGLLPPWLPPLTVYSDFLLWTRRRQIPAPPDFVLLVEMAVALGSSMNGKDL
jgi:hypothetical protein